MNISLKTKWMEVHTLTMNDLFRREKFGHLPQAISKEGKRTHTHEVGDIAD